MATDTNILPGTRDKQALRVELQQKGLRPTKQRLALDELLFAVGDRH